MGILSFFKKKPVFVDLVYRNKTQRDNGLIERVKASFAENHIPVIVYHFSTNHQLALDLLNQNQISHQEHHDMNWLPYFERPVWEKNPVAVIMPASILSGLLYLSFSKLSNSNVINIADVYLLEHHPIPSKDQLILTLEEVPSFKFNYRALVSFDEPLMKLFGSDRMLAMMDKMGMGENEVMRHPWISKSITRAQQRINQSATGDSECVSSEEWFSRYYDNYTVDKK